MLFYCDNFHFLEETLCKVSTVISIAQQQLLQILDIVNQKLPEAARQQMLGFLVAPMSNVGHEGLALESSLHPALSTSGFSPVSLNFVISV